MAIDDIRRFTRSINLAGLLYLAFTRIAASLAILLGLIFFVALAVGLAARGGISAAGNTIPEAWRLSLDYLAGLGGDSMIDWEDLRLLTVRSLGLLTAALGLAILTGLPLGGLAALLRHRRLSRVVLFTSLFGVSTPAFFAAMLLLWLNIWLGQLLDTRILPAFGFGWDQHMVIPTLVLAAVPAAHIARLSYNALVEELDADYVRTAHAKGLRDRTVFFTHVLRGAGVQILTTVGVSLRLSLAILPIIEYIFNWRGLGLTLLQAIHQRDAVAAITTILPLAVFFMVINILLELVYTAIDPRIRLGAGGAA